MNKIAEAKLAEKNPAWKGRDAGYGAIHEFVRKRKKKPKLCVKCRYRPAMDLANISGKYLRDLSDWEYLCRKCHMAGDGRSQKLIESGKSRKLPNKTCKQCKVSFHKDRGAAIFCSRACYTKNRNAVHNLLA